MSEFYKSFPIEEEISDKCIITLNFDLNTKIVEKNQKENNEPENYRVAYKPKRIKNIDKVTEFFTKRKHLKLRFYQGFRCLYVVARGGLEPLSFL